VIKWNRQSNRIDLEDKGKLPYVFLDLEATHAIKKDKETRASVVFGVAGNKNLYTKAKFIQFDRFTTYCKKEAKDEWEQFTPKETFKARKTGWVSKVDGKTWTPDTQEKNEDPTYIKQDAPVDEDVGFSLIEDSPNAPKVLHDFLVKDEKKGLLVKVVEDFRDVLILDKKVIANAKWKASFETGDKEVKFSDGSTGKGPPKEWDTLKGVIKENFPNQKVVDLE
jgi:hypothetical protein